MRTLYRERYEVPLVRIQGSLFLDALCQGGKVLLVNIIYQDIAQAVYYPPPNIEIPSHEADRACRLALGHFRSKSFSLYTEVHRDIVQRCSLRLDPNGPMHEGVLLQIQDVHDEIAAKGPNFSAP